MSTIFPSNPTLNEVYDGYRWNGFAWTIIGIDLTEDYATQQELDDHEISTTNVHGILDTSDLATETYAYNVAQNAQTNSFQYTNESISEISATAPITFDSINHVIAISQSGISISQSQVTDLEDDLNSKISTSIIDAKGDLIVGSAADEAYILGVGANNYVLTADSSEASGIKWAPASGGGGATGGGSDEVFFENDVTVSNSYTITSQKNAITGGPISISNGVTVTIPDGSVWTVI